MFSHMSARQIPEATRLAVENKDYRLALLLSQGATSQTVKNMIHKQLTDWNNTQVFYLNTYLVMSWVFFSPSAVAFDLNCQFHIFDMDTRTANS